MFVEKEIQREVLQFVEELFNGEATQHLSSVKTCLEAASQAVRQLGLKLESPYRLCQSEAVRALRIESPPPELAKAIPEYKLRRSHLYHEFRSLAENPKDKALDKKEAMDLIQACFVKNMKEHAGKFERFEVHENRYTYQGLVPISEDLHIDFLLYGSVEEVISLHFMAVISSLNERLAEINFAKIAGHGGWRVPSDGLFKESLEIQFSEPFDMLDLLASQFR